MRWNQFEGEITVEFVACCVLVGGMWSVDTLGFFDGQTMTTLSFKIGLRALRLVQPSIFNLL